MTQKLFPPFLNAATPSGERSHGAAVAVLQVVLLSFRVTAEEYGGNDPYQPDFSVLPKPEVNGVYDEVTVEHVRSLQEALGFPEEPEEDEDPHDWADGHLGPATRAKLVDELGLDLDAIPASVFQGVTYFAHPDSDVLQVWPPEKEEVDALDFAKDVPLADTEDTGEDEDTAESETEKEDGNEETLVEEDAPSTDPASAGDADERADTATQADEPESERPVAQEGVRITNEGASIDNGSLMTATGFPVYGDHEPEESGANEKSVNDERSADEDEKA